MPFVLAAETEGPEVSKHRNGGEKRSSGRARLSAGGAAEGAAPVCTPAAAIGAGWTT